MTKTFIMLCSYIMLES